MTTYTIDKEFAPFPPSEGSTTETAKKSNRAKRVFLDMAYEAIRSMSWLDTSAGKDAMERAEEVCEMIDAPKRGHMYTLSVKIGDWNIKLLASN